MERLNANDLLNNGGQTISKFVIVLSVLANLYCNVMWFYVSATSNTHVESVNQFLKKFPSGVSALSLNIFLLLLSVLSIIFMFRTVRRGYWKFILPIQLLFITYYLWQLM